MEGAARGQGELKNTAPHSLETVLPATLSSFPDSGPDSESYRHDWFPRWGWEIFHSSSVCPL